MTKSPGTLLYIALMGTILLSANGSASELTEQRVSDFRSEIGQRGALCGNLRIPCGSFTLESQRKKQSRVEIKEGSVAEVLRRTVKQNPSHDWAINDGVINILLVPKLAKVDRARSPLDRRISEINISNMTTDQAAQKVLEASGLSAVGRVHVGPRDQYGTVSLELRDVTLLQALNAVVKADGMASWGLEYTKQKKYAVDIFSWHKPAGRVGPR